MHKKRTIIIAVSLVLFLAIIGITYAWFSANVLGNEDASNVVIKSCALGIVYVDGPEINLNNAMPGNSESKTFTVTNTENNLAYYSINWRNIVNDFADKSELVYILELIDNDDQSLIEKLKEDGIAPSTDITIENLVQIQGEEIHTYRLTITFKNLSINQNYNQGKTFSGKVNINDVAPTYCDLNDCNELRHAIVSSNNGPDSIKELSTGTFASVASTKATSGLFKMADDYGDSYYFRGHRDYVNNNLLFAGFQWKIIRINGDGSLRLIYNGTEAQYTANGSVNTTEINTQLASTSIYNSSYTDNTYVGYKRGTAGATTYAAAHSNTTNSTVKTAVDNWYSSNIANKGTLITNKIVDRIFCNDRELFSGTGYGTGTSNNTIYAAYNRLYTNKTPKLMCSQSNDQYTVASGRLTYPVGLITADEVAVAGGVYLYSNNSFYLNTNQKYWTLSPYFFSGNSGGAVVFYINSTGTLSSGDVVNNSFGVRPVINLASDVTISSGNGSATNPYRIS